MAKLLVLYVFHIVNDRVTHFINNCIFYDDNVDFVVISNDKHNQFEVPPYVNTIFRDNIGYDFGGWSDALLTHDLYKHYDQFIFVNSSVYGPFISADFTGKWTDKYVNGLQDNVKLFGSTINTLFSPLDKSHVQSYIFSMEKETLQYLIDCGIFSATEYAQTFEDAIWKKEVSMSRKIIENGWNIGSLLTHYHGVDFTFKDKKPEDYSVPFLNDVAFPRHRGHLWHDEEVVFVKGNR